MFVASCCFGADRAVRQQRCHVATHQGLVEQTQSVNPTNTVIRLEKKWLDPAPWETVVTINQALCRDKHLPAGRNAQAFEEVQRLWEQSAPKSMSLHEALDVCRRCHEQLPFAYNNGNTFSAVAQTLVEDVIQGLPPVETHIARTTISHYVVGLIGKSELHEVLRHLAKAWKPRLPVPVPQPAPPPVQAAPQTI